MLKKMTAVDQAKAKVKKLIVELKKAEASLKSAEKKLAKKSKAVVNAAASKRDTLPPPKFQSVAMKFLVGASCDPFC